MSRNACANFWSACYPGALQRFVYRSNLETGFEEIGVQAALRHDTCPPRGLRGSFASRRAANYQFNPVPDFAWLQSWSSSVQANVLKALT